MKLKRNSLYLIICSLVFGVIGSRFVFLAYVDEYNGVNLNDLQEGVQLRERTVPALRGDIYDSNGNVLAQSAYKYRILAYLNPSRSKNYTTPKHVVDKEHTALVISDIIGEDYNLILNFLKKDLYQTYLGAKASAITTEQKRKIEEFSLPGIKFEAFESRSYPYGQFASYEIGYAKSTKDGVIGEMGVENVLNDYLLGENGYTKYVADVHGVAVENSLNTYTPAINGCDVSLTIERDIQVIIENTLNNLYPKYKPEEISVIVADAKTGEILGISTSPSFNPNVLAIDKYTNPNIEQSFEPGSVMKIYTFAAALNEGVIDLSEVYKSGAQEVYGEVINDWNGKGFGKITLEEGFIHSANSSIIEILENYLDKEKFVEYLRAFGFGEKTGIDLPRESSGIIKPKRNIEYLTAGFGQGITTTPIQQIQALSVITTKGSLMQPYIVDKIDCQGETVFESEPIVKRENVITEETAEIMMDLMYSVVNGNEELGISNRYYEMEKYELAGKTATAQIASSNGYLKNSFSYGFGGFFPYEDPEVIIYAYAKAPNVNSHAVVREMVTDILNGIGVYKGIPTSNADQEIISSFIEIPNYFGKLVSDVAYKNKRIIGDGKYVVGQYPNGGSTLNSRQPLYILTDGQQYVPNFIKMDEKTARIYANILGIVLKYEGKGSKKTQSVKPGTLIIENMEIVIKYSD